MKLKHHQLNGVYKYMEKYINTLKYVFFIFTCTAKERDIIL